ncbi:MAG: O-Antigen ligase [Sphingobacteriales bacterium]|nr:O-Antigen ligase [Sphingobacteriales bacterium]
MFLYLYTLTFGLFLTQSIRFPSPLLFGLTMIAIFWQSGHRFLYVKEAVVIAGANFFYYILAQQDIQAFSVNIIVFIVCFLYFNFFVGQDNSRLKMSIIMFYSLLILSAIVMLLNHVYPVQIISLRSRLIGAPIAQSPSGISSTIFGFGYQLAPLVSFLFVASAIYVRSWFIKIAVLLACLIAVYMGMQRSVLVTLVVSSFIFLVFYYKFKSIILIAVIVIVSGLFSIYFINSSSGNEYDNIFAKNERNAEEDRGGLMTENLRIYSNYPMGLMFYGKNWKDVTKYNIVYAGGITSHNAYLMFITYIGPFLGIAFLILVYSKIVKIFKHILWDISNKQNALLACLCFSFLAVTLNALFHNAWLIGADGPSVFVYCAILHRYNMQYSTEVVVVAEEPKKASVVKKKKSKALRYE